MKSHISFKKREIKLGVDLQILKEHGDISGRFKKTLYYGKSPKIDRPSLSLTDLGVRMFSDAVPSDHLGFIDMQYASQVGRKSCISPCSMMLAMVYIERLRGKNPDYIQSVSSSDLFLISIMVATKFLNDEGEDDEVFNGEWATAANMDVKELNKLEVDFLMAIDWKIFVSPAEFAEMMMSVETRVALMEGQKRGWYSYTDLDILARNIVFSSNWKMIKENIFKVIAVCSVAYAAAFCVLLGSTAIVSKGLRFSEVSDVQNVAFHGFHNLAPSFYVNKFFKCSNTRNEGLSQKMADVDLTNGSLNLDFNELINFANSNESISSTSPINFAVNFNPNLSRRNCSSGIDKEKNHPFKNFAICI